VQLQALDATLRGEPVLSIYLGLRTANPSDRRSWALDLTRVVKPVRASLTAAPHIEREGFEAAVRHAEQALQRIPPDAGGSTWIAFITPGGVRHSELATVAVPTVAAWGEGMRVAPYARVLHEDVPVVVVIADAAHADIWEYRDGSVNRCERVHAHHASEAPSHMRAGPRAGFHQGTHGAVAHDDVQRRRREGTRRMLEVAAARAARLAGPEGVICTGGIPHVSGRLAHLLSPLGTRRVRAVEGLDVHATGAEIAGVARASAATFRAERELADVRNLLEHAVPAGLGVLGLEETRPLLDQGRVQALFVSEQLLARHPAEAEDAVRSARNSGARAAVLAGAAGQRLDAEGGIAARLRYDIGGAGAPPRSA
jgi:hypothetical protein